MQAPRFVLIYELLIRGSIFLYKMMEFNILFTSIVTAIVLLVGSVIFYINWKQTYWTRSGLTQIEPIFFFGNIRKMILGQISIGEQFKQFYFDLKKQGAKHGGVYALFFSPMYVPVDVEIIKSIMVKDFSHFVNHGFYFNEERDPLSGHLFNLKDDKWKNLRQKLTPTFTSGKMKMMFDTFVNCTHPLKDILEEFAQKNQVVDIKDILGRFTTDIIASCAFGIECNSMKDPDAEFRKYGKKIFSNPGISRKLRALAIQTLPASFLDALNLKLGRPEIRDFFLNVVKDTVEHREKNNIYRKDFMHLLIQIKNMGMTSDGAELINEKTSNLQPAFTLNEIAAQVFVFFLAGFETSSNAMTFALCELSRNPEMQQKLRDEINAVLEKHDGKLTYDGVMEMHYLDKVINETLRKYPPLGALPRICTKDYPVPGTDVIIKTGTKVNIPVAGLHYDPEYYPDPQKFDPERFSEEAKSQRPNYTFLPFGEGPRMCIGLRFGLLQTKVGLVTAIKNFQIGLNEKTKYPLQLAPQFGTQVKGGVWLNLAKIE